MCYCFKAGTVGGERRSRARCFRHIVRERNFFHEKNGLLEGLPGPCAELFIVAASILIPRPTELLEDPPKLSVDLLICFGIVGMQ